MESAFNKIPEHLRKYMVEQDYNRYTPVDHAVWRFILRQLQAFLSVNGHESYRSGLEKTGISVEKIPSIAEISEKLEKFGWHAIPVSGFIPPAAFMELQAHSVLPIASDMRTIDHLMYTPAPDIVHEAAGHAPMLANPEYAAYLKKYAQIAKKAIISKQDLNLYEAIRELSDIKENPVSTKEEIEAAEEKLDRVSKSISYISEATLLGRMNWWTAEYGLIGDIKHPKIFGAGLLSSLGESREALTDKVKKIPLTVNCIETTYDITEPQPQLFVTPDFATLGRVLDEMTEQMAFKIGGAEGLEKALKSESVNTVQLETGLQISGVLAEYLKDSKGNVIFVKMQGPSQLSYKDQELPGHDRGYHQHGYSSPLGQHDQNINALNLNSAVTMKYTSGIELKGTLAAKLEKDGQVLLLSFKDCKVTFKDRVLFDPSWGDFDLALGTKVVSVFGGPADRLKFGELSDFVAARVPTKKYSEKELKLHKLYQQVRNLREQHIKGEKLAITAEAVAAVAETEFPHEWLLRLEIYELIKDEPFMDDFKTILAEQVSHLMNRFKDKKATIQDGIKLVGMTMPPPQ